jgi:adenosylcobinamide-GDP ribazoletransferase
VLLALPAGASGLAALAAAAGTAVAVSVVALRRFGGVTGDVLGATAKVAETAALLAAVTVLA